MGLKEVNLFIGFPGSRDENNLNLKILLILLSSSSVQLPLPFSPLTLLVSAKVGSTSN